MHAYSSYHPLHIDYYTHRTLHVNHIVTRNKKPLLDMQKTKESKPDAKECILRELEQKRKKGTSKYKNNETIKKWQ